MGYRKEIRLSAPRIVQCASGARLVSRKVVANNRKDIQDLIDSHKAQI